MNSIDHYTKLLLKDKDLQNPNSFEELGYIFFGPLLFNFFIWLKSEVKNSDLLLISKRIVNPDEYDTDSKLGCLLGYITANEYQNLDRTLDMYDYVVQVIIEQKEMNSITAETILNDTIYFL